MRFLIWGVACRFQTTNFIWGFQCCLWYTSVVYVYGKPTCTHVIIISFWLVCHIQCVFSIFYLSIPGITAHDRCNISHAFFFFSFNVVLCLLLLLLLLLLLSLLLLLWSVSSSILCVNVCVSVSCRLTFFFLCYRI